MNTPSKDHRRILIIDDNRAIHQDFRKIFFTSANRQNMDAVESALFDDTPAAAVSGGFTLEFASQGQEGLARVQAAVAQGRPYSVAFVDVRMPPGWDGIETVSRLWQVDGDLQVIICTAYSDYSLEEMTDKLGESDRFVVLKKPFDNIEVLQLAQALTEKWRLLQQSRLRTEELERHVSERTRELQTANKQLQSEVAERTRVEAALRQAQKMEAVGQLAGGIAHDFNNILTVIRGYTCCLLEDGHLEPQDQQALEQVDGAAERAANLTRQLLAFSRKQLMQPGQLDLNAAIGQIARMLRRVLGEDIALQIKSEKELPMVWADHAMIEQVILNLAVNARDAMPKGGQLLLRTAAVDLDAQRVPPDSSAVPGRFVCVTVTDTGCGIATDVMPHLFEPFFTTKEVGKGTGLGLATAYGIIKQHDGWIEVESKPGQGATFRIFLPEARRLAATSTTSQAAPEIAGGKEVILLVEDEPALRNIARIALERFGYRVITASSGVEARKLWAVHSPEIDLLLTDMVMPEGVSGRELAHQLKAEKSNLKVIYSSGYSQELTGGTTILPKGLNFLPKPYTPQQLAGAVRSCLDEADCAAALSS